MNKAAKATSAFMLIGILFVSIVAGGSALFGIYKFINRDKAPSSGSGPFSFSGNEGIQDFNCADNKVHTLTYSMKNALNSTGDETFDTAYRFTGSDGNVVAGTDSTSGSVALVCGVSYTIEQISASGSDGDSAKLKSVVSGNAKINSDGTATYVAKGPSNSLILGGQQHGVLEFRAKDIVNDGYMFDDQDGTATDYETDGVQFNSTTASVQAVAVGSGGELHFQIEYRPTVDDNVFGDIGGHYILLDASTTVWNVPTVKFNGKTLVDVKDSLNADEKKAYNAYEYVYLVSDEVTRNSQGTVDVQVFALSGVDPGTSDDIQVDVASRGAYTSTFNGNDVKVGSVQDNTAQTAVHTLMDTAIAVS